MESFIDELFEHEKLTLLSDPTTGLIAAIAIHSTALGPAVGGMRYQPYKSVTEAAVDALRLARAMTLKNSAAELGWGGGKLCVIDDGDLSRRHDRLLKVAGIVNDLNGRYIVGKDLGVTMSDMEIIASHSQWVVGVPESMGGLGDPSPATARTVMGAMEAAAQILWSDPSLDRMSASIIGTGGVGGSLARLLSQRGVTLLLADQDESRVSSVASVTGGRVVTVPEALSADVDFLAPCATGHVIGRAELSQLHCRVIAGGANNPLSDESIADELHRLGITYVPDFLANAGGVIQNAAEFRHEGMKAVDDMILRNDERIVSVLQRSREAGCTPLELARTEAFGLVGRGMT